MILSWSCQCDHFICLDKHLTWLYTRFNNIWQDVSILLGVYWTDFLLVQMVHQTIQTVEFSNLEGILALTCFLNPFVYHGVWLLVVIQLLLLFLQVPYPDKHERKIEYNYLRWWYFLDFYSTCHCISWKCMWKFKTMSEHHIFFIPAINLSHNSAPAVSHLSNELWVSGQVNITLVESFVYLTVPVHGLGQLRLHSLQNTFLLLQLCFHGLHGTRHHNQTEINIWHAQSFWVGNRIEPFFDKKLIFFVTMVLEQASFIPRETYLHWLNNSETLL